MKRRVVITGLGMVSPLGNTVEDSWNAALKGQSGIRLVDQFDTQLCQSKISGSVRGLDVTQYMPAKDVRRNDVFIHYGAAAAAQAMADSGLDVGQLDAERIGVALGSGIGGLPMIDSSCQLLREKGPKKVSPFFIPGVIINMLAGYVSIQYGLKGPNISIVTACTTGSHNIGMAARMIQMGDADAMLAGGAEMATSEVGLCGFGAMRALSTRNDAPEKSSRPWDRDRDGFVLGDGAGVLILEELEHAKKRGANIYAELAGVGMSADAHHITAPDSSGGERAMRGAMKDAGLNASDVQYVNAHATSTQVGDVFEVEAIKNAFGDHAKSLCVSSTKSMTGHLLGAAGAVEAIFTTLAIRDQVAPPTINLDNPDEGCDLNFVPHQPQETRIKAAISNSFGFGGTNGSLLFQAFDG